MKFDSAIFDQIKVRRTKEQPVSREHPTCDWEGCQAAAPHRAPMGRNREGEYLNFCLDHVRQYNKAYNYFSGMDNDAIAAYLKNSAIGHRPTWKMGANRTPTEADESIATRARRRWNSRTYDPFEFFRGHQDHGAESRAARRERRLTKTQRHAFEVLKLELSADKTEIKARFKELVKRHHPDANGGDRSLEERLRQVIQAYNILKQAGFC
ncbi:curved DNA-binding protein CbpA [Rhodobium orientis]|uniref:J domain-containing protein n=1 Tax=Rhodobium orientis TaxID=34017 RepID=A0A327JEK3_9HYPH|nr:J domain-containing protein [Rhodobium orientis]MBB4305671.1 curved DNA-binding protein CbpA [Rhodobium orientis]MBK5950947.1 hypothetical protein [Rhodobium orientis]RAI23766.1 hypothetical protein CH339_23135 [Rhodobium orientis]